MQFCATLIANAQAPIAMQPGEGALDDPAPASEAFARFVSAPRKAHGDTALAQQVAAERIVIHLVGMQLIWPVDFPETETS